MRFVHSVHVHSVHCYSVFNTLLQCVTVCVTHCNTPRLQLSTMLRTALRLTKYMQRSGLLVFPGPPGFWKEASPGCQAFSPRLEAAAACTRRLTAGKTSARALPGFCNVHARFLVTDECPRPTGCASTSPRASPRPVIRQWCGCRHAGPTTSEGNSDYFSAGGPGGGCAASPGAFRARSRGGGGLLRSRGCGNRRQHPGVGRCAMPAPRAARDARLESRGLPRESPARAPGPGSFKNF